jgi:3-methyl-2-oxobutanoate hydroxymethyltransferase
MSTIPRSPTAASPQETRRKVTRRDLAAKKARGAPITLLTAYDYPTARLIDAAGIDAILVGDSLGMVVLGYPNTLAVTMEDMLHHCRAVARGAAHPLLIGDMPFMSYQVSVAEAVRNAGRFLQEAGMDTVKLEGGRARAETVAAIVAAGIPVMGHLGLTPQSVHQLGGFRPQGRDAAAAVRLLADARALEEAGCYAIVLESVPARLAAYISAQLTIPTIGIGAGVGCDGQVLVTHDLLGLYDQFTPRFVKQYANLHAEIGAAFAAYRGEVETRQFPTAAHSVDLPEDEWNAFLAEVAA